MKTLFVFSVVLLTLAMNSQADACNGPIRCAIKTVNGHYLTAVSGGGRTTDVIHTDATTVQAWEVFTLHDTCSGASIIDYAIQTSKGNYLTAVGGGNRTTDVIHSDATKVQSWEKFKFLNLSGGKYAIRTVDGHYLTAVSGGGRIVDTIHSDATQVQAWETFDLVCGY